MLAGVLSFGRSASAAAMLDLQKGDHICIIGNTLAERMQYFGWLEAMLQSRFPQNELVIRNLGYSGDEIGLRLRSASFGSPDEWLSGEAQHPRQFSNGSIKDPVSLGGTNRIALTDTRADVIFAFFGYNESFAGEIGLAASGTNAGFKANLDKMLKGMLAKQYNGRTAPRIVLFSPIAHEDLKDPNFSDGKENNARLKLYTATMAEVAKANGVPFVDLFAPTAALYGKATTPLTINGIHLTEEGDREVAAVIDQALFGNPTATNTKAFDAVRQAVLDKNFYWYHRYRTTDGYNVYGNRAFLGFIEGNARDVSGSNIVRSLQLPSNYEVLQREMQMIDVMTSNRDKRIWALSQGRDLTVDDKNIAPPLKVGTNERGKLPSGGYDFAKGEDAIKSMKPGTNMQISLFASEEQFPDLAKPVQMAFDTQGRLWVAVWPTYPHWNPSESVRDKLIFLEDTNGDGKADKSTVFADNLDNPTGFEFWGGGVILAQTPNIVFLKDTNGDGKADVRKLLVHGMDTADSHHSANSFVLDPGGAMYWQEGTFHHTQSETPYGPPVRSANGAVYRFEPRTAKLEVYVPYGFANPHGHVFDRWGEDIVTDATGAQPYFAASFSGWTDYPRKHAANAPTIYRQRTRPCPGIEILSSRLFPDELQGNLLVGNDIGVLGILQYKVEPDGGGFKGTELEPIVTSTDPNFRPADIEIGPDGAIWFLDWQNPLIGHMQHNLRDDNRDHSHGRVYRVSYAGRPLDKPARIAGESVENLLELLKDSEDRVRYRTRIELSGRAPVQVIAAAKQWMTKLAPSDKDYEHHMLEALWLHQSMNVVNEELLRRELQSPEPRVRAAATRVLCYWRDRVRDPLGLLEVLAKDDNALVRLEAVRACSFFKEVRAAQAALESLSKPSDRFLKYTLDESMATLDKYTKPPPSL